MNAAHPSHDLERARALYDAGCLADAGRAYRAVLEAEPRHAEALWRLGDVANRLGMPDKALDLVRSGIIQAPEDPQAWNCLGTVHAAAGRFEDAVKAFAHAIALRPTYVVALSNLGKVYVRLGRLVEAVAAHRHCVRDEPAHAAHHADLGNALLASEDPGAAIAAFGNALTLDPALAEAGIGLGLAQAAVGNAAAAVRAFADAARRHPGLADAHHNLGLALFKGGRLEDAVDAFRAAIACDPAHAAAHTNLIFALDLDPRVGLAEATAERRRWAARHAAAPPRSDHANLADPERRLRIGYVSGDFKAHSAAEALMPVILGHSAAFEAVCYSHVRAPDAVTERFRAAVPLWREAWQMDDTELERCIRDDAIDILVDLSGYTEGNRLAVFARRPAPVQVQAWGYPLGSGMDAIDYLLSDPVLIPQASRHHFVEVIHDLPGFMAFAPPQDSPALAPPAAAANGFVTFGSMNRLTKINDAVLATWAEILLRLPRARLLAKDPALDDEHARAHVLERLTARGVAGDRVMLRGRTSRRAHLATYAEIDLALDPFPQSGGITTFEALWMGVPVITLAGERPQGRASASILSGVGLGETIATTTGGYVDTAVDWAGDVQRLRTVRAGLRDRLRGSPFCDHAAYSAAVEAGYRGFWQRWCKTR
jgi:predicted O-linked N-acetylglucosamine transferase (SPINDLY family)